MVVQRAQCGAEGVGVRDLPDIGAAPGPQAIGQRQGSAGEQPLEKARRVALFQRMGDAARQRLQRLGAGEEGAQHHTARHRMRPEQREGIGVARGQQRGDLSRPGAPARHRENGTFQISAAYSEMLRSAENQPMPAVFSTALRRQATVS